MSERIAALHAKFEETLARLKTETGTLVGTVREEGSRGVLEVRCHEAPFVLEHGQVVGRLVYERMAARPDRLYGAGIKSNYQGQGLKLAKQFR